MAMKLMIAIVVIAALIGVAYRQYDQLTRPLPIPTLDTQKYWGPGDVKDHKADTKIKPFKVHYEQQLIDDLRKQLNRTLKLTEPLEGIQFQYGFNSRATEQLVEYWRDDYLPRWTEREEYLNKLPQFTTEIQGLRIHFIHAKPSADAHKKKRVLPLLLLHGWPGSVREFYNLIPMLTEANDITDYVFEVIAPSLVGYGWSQAASKPGMNAAQMAIVMRNLMRRLGHEQFLVQGGDWGSIIGAAVATLFPSNVLGYHSNMCVMHTPLSIAKNFITAMFPDKFLPSRFFYDHHLPLKEKFTFLLSESGYFHIQATKPDTIGAVLDNSPVGLAAYILEKFQTAAGPGRNQKFETLATLYTLDAVLDNVMIYYLTHSATTAGRFYAENMSKDYLGLQMDRVQSRVPMGCARFKNDLPAATDWQLMDKYPNLIHSKYFHQGGHFAALEVPVMLYTDFVEFIAAIKFQ